MVSLKQKRLNNVYEEISTDDSDYEYINVNNRHLNNNKGNFDGLSYKLSESSMAIKKAKYSFPFSSNEYDKMSQSSRKQKCFSKNALMARENRIKKKIYVQNLEESVEKFRDENKKLSSILDNQSSVISDLRKEVKYLKNVLANSTDIGRLLKCINQNTGMPVATSLNNSKFDQLSLNNSVHPWAEEEKLQLNTFSNIEYDEINGEFTRLFCDLENDSKLDDLFSDLPSSLGNQDLSPEVLTKENEHLDHDYTNTFTNQEDEGVGVCLHIAKHKVSLEFCSSCSENASTVWNES